ncbi:hypothetical protein [Succinimonas amylolytica]|uniref:hypothetical protein n=1 Tax=Succinimonas amylolytica TaxID=83769 RepID=UPI0023A8BA7C
MQTPSRKYAGNPNKQPKSRSPSLSLRHTEARNKHRDRCLRRTYLASIAVIVITDIVSNVCY